MTMKQIAEFLLQYGWVGTTVILGFVCAFLYREAKKKDDKIYSLYEAKETMALKFSDGMDEMRRTVEKLVEKVQGQKTQ